MLRLANDLDQSLQEVCDDTALQEDINFCESEDRTVHEACVSAKKIAKAKKLNEYYSSTEMTLQAQKDFVDP